MDADRFALVSWVWGLSLIVLTIAVHAIGVVMMALAMARIRFATERRRPGLGRVIPIVIGVVASVGLLLAVLHGIEAAVWAAAYMRLGLFSAISDAMLYSIGAMTTARVPGLELEGHWRMMGTLEAAGGMLLFGLSTAYIFAVIQVYWPMLHIDGRPRRGV